MSSNLGISRKGITSMMSKNTPPRYVYNPKYVGTDHRPAGRVQGRNELCRCGSGSKYKNCCQYTQVSKDTISKDIVKVPGFERSLNDHNIRNLSMDK